MNVASISSGNANVSERLGALNLELVGLRTRLRERQDEIARMQAARCSDGIEISKLRERIKTMASANASESEELERKIRESKVILTDDGASGWLGAERAAYAQQQSSVVQYEARVRKQEQEIVDLRNTLQVNHKESEELKHGLQVYKEDANRARKQHAVVAEQLTATSNRLQQLSESWEGEKARDQLVMIELRKENERLRKENAMLSSGLMEADKRWRKAKDEIHTLKLTSETKAQLIHENEKLKEQLAEAKSRAKVMAGLAIAGAQGDSTVSGASAGGYVEEKAEKGKGGTEARESDIEVANARREISTLTERLHKVTNSLKESERERTERAHAFQEKETDLNRKLETAKKHCQRLERELKGEEKRCAELQKRHDGIISRFDLVTSETRSVIEKATKRSEILEERLKTEVKLRVDSKTEMKEMRSELENELLRVRREAAEEKERATNWQNELSTRLATLSADAKEAVETATLRAATLEKEIAGARVRQVCKSQYIRRQSKENSQLHQRRR